MILSDNDIRRRLADGDLVITPLDGESAIQPASVELTLDLTGGAMRPVQHQPGHPREIVCIAPGVKTAPKMVHDCCEDGDLVLQPGACALVSTRERVVIPPDLVAQVNGKSSLARLFLIVHTTAGFIDPGFPGQITLEFVNLSPQTMIISHGARVAQLVLSTLTSPAARPYGSSGLGSHYHGQSGATASRYGEDV